jgi:hypothetical protein
MVIASRKWLLDFINRPDLLINKIHGVSEIGSVSVKSKKKEKTPIVLGHLERTPVIEVSSL